jgi:hypothetical protein
MAEVSGIAIDVDINIGEAMTKIATLKASLMSLGDDLDLDVDFEDLGLDDLGLGEDSFDLSKAINIDEIDPSDLDLSDTDLDLDDKLRIKADADVDLGETTVRDAIKSEEITPDKIDTEASVTPDLVKKDLEGEQEAKVRVSSDLDLGEMEDNSLKNLIDDVKLDHASDEKGGESPAKKQLLSFLSTQLEGDDDGGGGKRFDGVDSRLTDLNMGEDFGDITNKNKRIRDIFSDARDTDGFLDGVKSIATDLKEERVGFRKQMERQELFRPSTGSEKISGETFPVGLTGNTDDDSNNRKFLMSPNMDNVLGNLDAGFGDSNRMFRDSADGADDAVRKTKLLKEQFNKIRALNPIGDSDESAVGKIAEATPDLRDALPTMRMWWSVIGALLPLLISTVGAALGLAAAFGTVAGAGAAFIGLGLVGHAQNMDAAMQQAQQRVKDLKAELFSAFQGPAQAFAPIQARIFDMIPGEATRLAESLESLTVFEDTVIMSIRGLIGWASSLIGLLVGYRDEIDQAVGRFGTIIGKNINNFIAFVIEEVAKNQGSLIAFGSLLKDIIIIIFNLAKMFSGVMVAFAPLIEAFRAFTGLLQNDFLKTLFVAVATFLLLSNLFAKIGLGAMIKGFYGMASSMMSATVTAGSLGAALEAIRAKLLSILAITGIGLVLAAAGSAFAAHQTSKMTSDTGGGAGSGGFGAGGQTVINNQDITVQGDMDRQSLDRLGDSNARNELDISENR